MSDSPGNQYKVQPSEGRSNTHHGARGRHPDREEIKQAPDAQQRLRRRRDSFAGGVKMETFTAQ